MHVYSNGACQSNNDKVDRNGTPTKCTTFRGRGIPRHTIRSSYAKTGRLARDKSPPKCTITSSDCRPKACVLLQRGHKSHYRRKDNDGQRRPVAKRICRSCTEGRHHDAPHVCRTIGKPVEALHHLPSNVQQTLFLQMPQMCILVGASKNTQRRDGHCMQEFVLQQRLRTDREGMDTRPYFAYT